MTTETPPNNDKTLFILKAKPDSLLQAETWLRGKGWIIESTIQVKDALPRILSARPKFIIVCMDHPNTKVRMLPKLFESAFQTKVIAYLEGSAASSLAVIAGMEYVLYPPISGTMIDRMTGKIERDQKRKLELEAQRSGGIGKASLGTTNDGMIAIKGSAAQAEESARVSESARAALAKMLQSESSGKLGSATESSGGSSTGFSSGSPTANSSMALSSSPTDLAALSHAYGKASQGANGHGEALNAHSNYPTGVAELKNNAPTGGHRLPDANDGAPNMQSNYPTGVATANNQFGPTASKESADPASAHKPRKVDSQGRTVDDSESHHSPVLLDPKTKKTKTFMRAQSSIKADANIVLNTQQAINILADMDTRPVNTIAESTDLVCVFIHSKQYHGFLLCGISDSKKVLGDFATLFRDKLIELMNLEDGDFLAGAPITLHVQHVQLEEWSKLEAEFVKKFSHLGRECVVAFFNGEIPPPDLKPAIQQDMVSISIDELHPDRRLEFDLFLHLTRNQKFVQYGKRHRRLTKKQRSSLLKKGVTTVHLPEDQMDELLRYRLQAHIDQKITEHKESEHKKVVSERKKGAS